MEETLSRSAKRFQDALLARGIALEVIELPASTRTAADAAAAIGCTIAQIAKSIVFRTAASNRPILVIASGVNRINEAAIHEHVGEAVVKADAAFVRDKTGFAIGGVPPLGHNEPIDTIIDVDLLALGDIWAAAGTPNAVFRLNGELLAHITTGKVMSIM